MGIEREGKSGGGFFQLFDWSAKSRKKLFSSKSDLPERSKQGKRSDGNLPATRLHLIDEDDTGAGSSIKGSSDYSCASSVTDDDGYGARAPGVVARLMGLDSLPTTNFSEPYSTPYFDTQSLRDAQCRRKNLDYQHDPRVMYSGNLLYKVDGTSGNFVELKPQKVQSKPIEKFQTEVLPPKSAKSIPVTHHKLLSPIKNPGFIPMKNAAHIMEAAARIIEASPQATTKTRIPLVGSSSVPIKVRDLKEKVEAARKMPRVQSKVQDIKEKVEAGDRTSRLAEASQRPVESKAAKYLKGQSLNKSWNDSVNTSSRSSPDNEDDSSSLKNNGKSISLAIQAKVNVQKREGLSLSSSRTFMVQKEQNEVKSLIQPFKSQPNVQKDFNKKSPVHTSSGVLRQNNQKQNCRPDKDKLTSKPSVSNLPGRKVLSGDPSYGRSKASGKIVGNSKTGSRKLGLDAMDSEKGVPYSSARNYPRKKRSIERGIPFEKNQVADSALVYKNNKAVQSTPVFDRHFSWAEDSKKKGMDVVSFTFTAPLARSMPGSDTSSQVAVDNRSKRLLLDTEGMKLSSLGYNDIGGDALSLLLEQKIRELSNGANSSRHDSFKVGSASSSSPILEDLVPTLNTGRSMELHNRRDQDLPLVDKLSGRFDFNFSSSESSRLALNHKFQMVDEDCSSSNADCRHPSPVSVLEPSISIESCNSSDSADTSSLEGSKHCSSVQAQEILGSTPLKKSRSVEVEMELSDSASSSSTGTVTRKHGSAVIATDHTGSTREELDYVKEILSTVELMFKDFSLGQAREIINPHLFDKLEGRKGGFVTNGDTASRRKLLFDCVSECLDLRCRRYVGGGYRAWVKGVAMVRRNEWLAEEVHNEISSWRGMGDCMVDELVDKDMSSQQGRWLEYEVDAFALGVEIEGQIFNSLVDEVIASIFVI